MERVTVEQEEGDGLESGWSSRVSIDVVEGDINEVEDLITTCEQFRPLLNAKHLTQPLHVLQVVNLVVRNNQVTRQPSSLEEFIGFHESKVVDEAKALLTYLCHLVYGKASLSAQVELDSLEVDLGFHLVACIGVCVPSTQLVDLLLD